VQEALLVRVLDGQADLAEEGEAFRGRQAPGVAEVRDPRPQDELHHEVGAPGRRHAGVVDLRDRRVVHQGQGLALGFEARHDLARVHAELDALERHLALDRLLLPRAPDGAHPACADLLDQDVAIDSIARSLAWG
jgi:hypothetical protein